MIKRQLTLLFLLVLVFFVSMKSSGEFRRSILEMTDVVKGTYHYITQSILESLEEHFSQQETIRDLRVQLARYQTKALLSIAQESEIRKLSALKGIDAPSEINISLAKTLSYVELGDFRKVWLDTKDLNASRIYGLVQDQYAAGIVLSRNGRPLGLLNGDPKSGYGVFIGQSKAPGIIRGKPASELIIADFIPAWMEIKKDDEVVTNGLDGIFFEGIPVGKVISIDRGQGYKIATIKPYARVEQPEFFWLIDSYSNP